MVKLVVSLVFIFLAMKLGIIILRGLARPAPEPPPTGEMRRVSLKYRCPTCGVALKMTAAPDSDPPPPRHCMEDMQLVAPIE
ncbi:MAG TPA: hypothetical protein VMZ51_04350 [Acidimicrobiales bacterium]|nr:hypothetical protein [Acidimicrobiales bacterium]